MSALFAASGCTDPVERTQVVINIDADESIRSHIRYVDIEVRAGSDDEQVWDLERPPIQHLLRRGEESWPIRLTLARRDNRTGYRVSAIARDADDKQVGVQRAESGFIKGRTLTLDLKFDAACFNRTTQCSMTYTCKEGRCYDPEVDVEDLSPTEVGPGSTDQPVSGQGPGTRMDPQTGNSGSGAAGAMSTTPRGGAGAGSCSPGAPGCGPACPTRDDKGVCLSCPVGFLETAADGCVPVLTALGLSKGTLTPSFDSKELTYTAEVPMLATRVTLDLETAASVELMVNGERLTAPQWTGPLELGENNLAITLNAPGRPSRTYRLTLRRAGKQVQQLTAAGAANGDGFGINMAATGDWLVVGAPFTDTNGANDSGAAYVFKRGEAGWSEAATLKADSPRTGAKFGNTVAIDGETLVVAAAEEPGGGAIYVFELQAGAWTRVERFMGEAEDVLLGRGLAIDGDHIFGGAPGADMGASEAGSVHVFEREGGVWKRKSILHAASPGLWDFFGSCVAAEGDTLLVGATARTVPGQDFPSGAVYVFKRGASEWSQTQMIWDNPPIPNAFWGEAISIQGDQLVGAGFFGLTGLTGGSAAVFTRAADGQYAQEVVLRPTNTRGGDGFGNRVLFAGESLIIAASGESSAAPGVGTPATGTLARSGAVYLFERRDAKWEQAVQIKSDAPVQAEELGRGIAVSGDDLVIGAPAIEAKPAVPGSVYVFR